MRKAVAVVTSTGTARRGDEPARQPVCRPLCPFARSLGPCATPLVFFACPLRLSTKGKVTNNDLSDWTSTRETPAMERVETTTRCVCAAQ